MSYNLSAVPKLQFFDNDGNPLVGGKLYTYEAGTTTPLATYTDSTGATPNTNPIILDSRGEANVWLAAQSYKFILKTSTDTTIWTVDNISNAINVSQILASSGTASAPPYSFSADTDTGMYLNAVGQVALSAGGAPVLRAASTSMILSTSGTDRLTITSAGDVGIGVTPSSARFQVLGAGTSTSFRGNVNGVFASNGAGYDSTIRLSDTVSNSADLSLKGNVLAMSVNGTFSMYANDSGNVGIGTASPTDNLDVVGTETASNVSIFARNLSTTTNSNSRLGLRGNNDAVRATFLLDGLGTIFSTGGILYTETNHPLLFGTNSVEQMRVTSGGDVGIGTTSPASKLSVSKASAVQIQATTGTVDFRIQSIDAIGGAYAGAVSNHALLFTTNNIARLKIDTDGSQSSVNPGTSTLYPQYACRAWVNFNGLGGATIRAAGNVSSVTYGGTGIYTVNFSTAMPDANYAPQASVSNRSTAQDAITQFNTPSTTSIGMDNYEAGVRADNSYIYVAVFR